MLYNLIMGVDLDNVFLIRDNYDEFKARLEWLINEVEQWNVDEEDPINWLYKDLNNALLIYVAYFSPEEEEEEEE